MANINLLPWREELRLEKRNEFVAIVLAVVFLAVVMVALWSMKVGGDIDDQIYRNNFVQKNIAELETEVAEIKGLNTRREELIARMEVIQGLQGNRAVIVHSFDQLVRTLPDGVFYERISRKGARLTIVGVAESTNRISNLMRNLEDSPWFAAPNLSKVVAESIEEGVFEDNGSASRFTLSVQVSDPRVKNDEEAG